VILDLKKRSAIGIVFYMIAVSVVLLADGYYLRYPSFSLQFVLLVFGICLFRLLHRVVEPWLPARLDLASLYVFIGSIGLTGLIWGVGFAKFILQEGEPQNQILMVVCTIGLCSGGVVAYIPFVWLAVAFNLFILGPGLASMLATQLYLPLASLVSLFCVYMVFLAVSGNQEYWDALENEFLLEEKTKDLEGISQKDGLTGLYNRRYFDTAFELEWKRGVRNQTGITLMIFDIDHFKQVNDTFGHLAGDEYLKLTARLLSQVFQRETDMVARYGGEEFVILLPEATLEKALDLAERMRKKMVDSVLEFEAHFIRATISIGVARLIPQTSGERTLLISRADYALYAAKRKGRNQVCVVDDNCPLNSQV